MKIRAAFGLSNLVATLLSTSLWAPAIAAPDAPISPTAPSGTFSNMPLPGAPKAVVPTPEMVEKWYQNQWFDEAIDGATRAIAASASPDEKPDKKPDPRLFYYRGRAFYSTGFFRRAEEDLAPLGDFRPFPRWTAASEIVGKVRVAKAFVPPNIHEVKDDDGHLRFLIYYGHDDAWTRAVVDALQEAYAANFQMIGFARPETPVFLFDSAADFAAFSAARAGKAQPSWPVGMGGSFGFYMRRLTPKNARLSASSLATLRTVVTHEYHHSIINRYIGNDVFPKWMAEGLARCAADIVVPAQIERDDEKFARVWRSGGVLSFEQISDRSDFMAAMEEKNAPQTPLSPATTTEKTGAEAAPKARVLDPYAQSHDMARFFLEQLKPGEFSDFLVDLRAARDFDDAFESHVRLSPTQFYEKWRANRATRYGEMGAAR